MTRLVRGIRQWKRPDGCALTIGNFDGVHRGHQALVERAIAHAARLSVASAALSFEPTPRELFAPQHAPGRISTLRGKLCALADLGLDALIVQRFDQAFAALAPEAFIDDWLVHRLGVRALIVGDDFRFGAGRGGDLALLESAGRRHGFAVERVGSIVVDGERCSSTAVRAALAVADLERAAALLGRRYAILGRIRRGLQLGRRLGMPTANIGLARRPALRLGVYAVELQRRSERGRWYPGVANLGVRPTLGLTRCLLETHLLDARLDLYGEVAEVRFCRFLRPEARFDSLDALAAQMQQDRAAALAFFGRAPA